MKKLKKIDNAGFSLVELLVAVVILGLIVAPLLHTFVTASDTAARSRKMGDATLASQNIAETIEANDLSSFVGSVSPDENGKYTVSMDGVQAGKSTFKAQVTLDPQTSGTESPFQSINAEEITDYSNMDAVFAQSQDAADDPDQISLANFNAYAATYTRAPNDTPAVSRLIAMTLSKESGKESGKVYAKLVYTYTYTFTSITISSDGSNVPTPQTFTDKQTYELFPQGFSTAKSEGPNIYLLYNPWYGGDMLGDCDKKTDSTYNKVDVVLVENADDIPFRFFLVKQRSSAVTSEKEGQYSADIILKESDSAVYRSTVFSNVNEDVTGTSASRIANVRFKLQSGAYKYTLFTSSITGDLVSKSARNRIYQVTIKIYPSGTTDYTTPLCTFTTTKLQ